MRPWSRRSTVSVMSWVSAPSPRRLRTRRPSMHCEILASTTRKARSSPGRSPSRLAARCLNRLVWYLRTNADERSSTMQFKNVPAKHNANVYHGGKVTSRPVITPEGEMKTLGVMLPGIYRFSTQAPERVDITQGKCRVKLAHQQAWSAYQEGMSFTVPGNSHFEIEVDDLLDYV